MYDRLSESQQRLLSRSLGILFIVGTIAGAIFYRHRMDSPNYFPIPDSTGHTFVQELSFLLIAAGILVFLFGFVSNLFKMRKFLESPREKAERFIKDFNSNPSKVHTYSYAGSEFRDWLKGSLENRYSDYAGLDDISDYELAMIYEFSEATRTEVLEKINNLIYLLMFVAWSLVVGFILR